jgi:hypothetical protein
MMDAIPRLLERQAKTRDEYLRFLRLSEDPLLSARARDVAFQFARSCAASLTLGRKAIYYHTPHPDPEIERQWALYRLFNLPLSTHK